MIDALVGHSFLSLAGTGMIIQIYLSRRRRVKMARRKQLWFMEPVIKKESNSISATFTRVTESD